MAQHDIGWAVDQLWKNVPISRRGWNGPNQFLTLQKRDGQSHMTLPYVFITTVQGDRVPWLCSQTDLLARDWYACRAKATPPPVQEYPSTDEQFSPAIPAAKGTIGTPGQIGNLQAHTDAMVESRLGGPQTVKETEDVQPTTD